MSTAPAAIQLPKRLNENIVLAYPEYHSCEAVVDGSNIQFVEPIGLVQLSLMVRRLAGDGCDVAFLAPRSSSVNAYLARMNFYTNLPLTVHVESSLDVSSLGRNDRGDVLVELRRFVTDDDVEDMMEPVLRYLQNLKVARTLYRVLTQAIPELCGNASSHGKNPCGGFLAAQTYLGCQHYLAVGDAGMGIRRHLVGNEQYAHIATDVDAIAKALEPAVTGTSDKRGYGLPDTVEALSEAADASLVIRSGNGWVRICTRKGQAPDVQSGTERLHVAGTLIQIAIKRLE